ncbi:hypothetical protein ABZ079_24575 [Streptomyces sp. NPDC006314]|uniref:hypothetical protein n=1 Tax=Streptomyces sp. NPDC006314 TaxID=3154475 RepID=UPI0033BF026B
MRQRTLTSLLAAVVLGAAAGCSSGGQEREFAIPKNLCGVAVPSGPLARILPPTGKSLDQRKGTPSAQAVTGCEVTVDGDVVLTVEGERIKSGRSAWIIASYDHRIGHVKSGDGGAIAYVGRAAVSVVPCPREGDRQEAVSTYIRTLKPWRQDESAMRQLIRGYTASLKTLQPCRTGS